MHKICIDARFYGVADTGIGRYVENLIDHLPTDSNTEIVLIVHPKNKDIIKIQKFKLFFAVHHPYTLMSLLEMHWLLMRIRPNLVHIPHVTVPFLWPGKIILTLHDLIKHYSRGVEASTHSKPVYYFKYLEYLAMVWFSIHRASHIVTPSNYWKKAVIKEYGIKSEKITVTYEGAYPLKVSPFKTKDDQISEPYLLYVGNLYPHKNVPILIKAAEQLKIKLKIVCARNIFESRLPRSDYVHFLGKVDDTELVQLYAGAFCFVFPSKIEGFGLPGLEAMASGCPVIAANASCLPEIYQDAALYFNPDSEAELIEKILLLQTDKSLRKALIVKGLAQVKKYSWAKMADVTWQIYQNELR